MEEYMMIKKSFIILMLMALAIWSTSATLYAQAPRTPMPGVDPPSFERIGKTGWQFLHLPTVARNAALADVKNGLTDNNVTAIFSNPANMVDIKNIDASFTKINYVADISFMTAALAKNFGNWGVFGVHFAFMDLGDMVRTENAFDPNINMTERSGDLGTFTASDMLIGLSYGRSVTDKLSIGANISFIQEKLDQTKVKNWNTDFGICYLTGFRSLRLSMVARNFGPDTEFTGFTELYGLPQSVRMPIDFRLGVGYDFIEYSDALQHRLTGLLEGVHPNDGPERVHAALEYTFMNVLFLRGGYKFNYDEQGLTVGGGVDFDMEGIEGRIDYAYLDYGRLTSVHLFTVGFGFNK